MNGESEYVRCPSCGTEAEVNEDGVFICRCGCYGSAEGMDRLPQHGPGWTPANVERALNLLRALVHAVERLSGPPAGGIGLAAHVFPKGEPVSVNTNPPRTIDTNENIGYIATPVDAAGNAVADTLTWASSDPTVLALTPSADTLSCLATTLKAGSATVTVSDAAGNSTSESVSVATGAATSIGLTGTTKPK